jgi:alpha-glucosidase (family GH31 glycosyl hydrolase)
MQAHGRFEQEAWRYDDRTLGIYRDHVLLHERLVAYIRAAAATAERSGLPIVRPLSLVDPADARASGLADAYAFGPSLWIAPVLEAGASERRVYLPAGEWLELAGGLDDLRPRALTSGAREVLAQAPRERIPVWVRRGAIVITYPAAAVAAGLGEHAEGHRPLEATLWGEPRCGRAATRLADGTKVRWERGRWSCDPDREIAYRIVPIA